LAKVTLSVPDDLYAKIEEYKDHLNLSDIFRVAVSEEIGKLQGKAEIIVNLHKYLMTRLSSTEMNASREAEKDRFTRKWGEPETIKTETAFIAQPPYVQLRKIQPIKFGDKTLTTLKIFNDIPWKSVIHPSDLLEFDAEKWKSIANGKLGYLVDYFKSKGFIVGEYQRLTPAMVADFVTDGDMKTAEEIGTEFVPGLFALDKEDMVFIGYRKAKWSKTVREEQGKPILEEIKQ